MSKKKRWRRPNFLGWYACLSGHVILGNLISWFVIFVQWDDISLACVYGESFLDTLTACSFGAVGTIILKAWDRNEIEKDQRRNIDLLEHTKRQVCANLSGYMLYRPKRHRYLIIRLELLSVHLGPGLPPYQVASWSIELFGHNRHGQKLGAVPLWGRRTWVPISTSVSFTGLLRRYINAVLLLIQFGKGRGLPARQVSSWSVQPFGHNTPTLQTGQADNGPIA